MPPRRPIKPGEKFDRNIHIDRRSGGDRRGPAKAFILQKVKFGGNPGFPREDRRRNPGRRKTDKP